MGAGRCLPALRAPGSKAAGPISLAGELAVHGRLYGAAMACLVRLVIAGALAPLSFTVRAAEPFRVVAFAGASNLPLWAGQEVGLFARRGLEVSLDITPNSVEMARNLQSGRYDLALTAVDNVVAYDEGQGEAGMDPADFVALFGVDDGMLSLVAKPTIPSVAALRDRSVSVDAATTGFAFALREILTRAGVPDARLVKVGGGAQRLAALLDGGQDATLLNTPLDIAAETHGFHALARVTDQLGAYQGVVAAVRRERVQQDHARLVAFTAGFHDSVAWVTDPAHHDAVVALLVRHMPDLSAEAAESAAKALLDPVAGLYRDLRIDPAGLRVVLALRSKYGLPRKDLTDPARYVDPSVAGAVLAP